MNEPEKEQAGKTRRRTRVTTKSKETQSTQPSKPVTVQTQQPLPVPPVPTSDDPATWSAYQKAWKTYCDQRREYWTAKGQPERGERIEGEEDYRAAWRIHWEKQGQLWRTEPEINQERKQELAGYSAIKPDIKRGIYPFKGIRLDRADLEWLVATKVDKQEGLDLRGAILTGVDLGPSKFPRTHNIVLRELMFEDPDQVYAHGFPLDRMLGGLTVMDILNYEPSQEQFEMAAVHLESAFLVDVHLEGAILCGAYLERALFRWAHLERADLSGAFLKYADFSSAYLIGAQLGGADLEEANFGHARLEGANLQEANLKKAHLIEASLRYASLGAAHLEDAYLTGANLAGARLSWAHLEGVYPFQTYLGGEHVSAQDLVRIRRWVKDFPEDLPPASLQGVFFDDTTNLADIVLGNESYGFALLGDIRWRNVNLAVIDWAKITMVGDERQARQRKGRHGELKSQASRLSEYQDAVRANRQIATALRAQGINEQADRFAYRAQLLQRVVLRRQKKPFKYLGSWILWLIAGYGYRPFRSILIYLILIFGFAIAYFFVGPIVSVPFSPLGALVFSVTSFHGRGFFPGGSPGHSITLDDPLTVVAAAEAVVGLLIEISFIATFTQRYFGK